MQFLAARPVKRTLWSSQSVMFIQKVKVIHCDQSCRYSLAIMTIFS